MKNGRYNSSHICNRLRACHKRIIVFGCVGYFFLCALGIGFASVAYAACGIWSNSTCVTVNSVEYDIISGQTSSQANESILNPIIVLFRYRPSTGWEWQSAMDIDGSVSICNQTLQIRDIVSGDELPCSPVDSLELNVTTNRRGIAIIGDLATDPTPTPPFLPTDTPVPTDTPTGTPDPTSTPEVTNTPAPTDTPIPTPAPTATPTVTDWSDEAEFERASLFFLIIIPSLMMKSPIGVMAAMYFLLATDQSVDSALILCVFALIFSVLSKFISIPYWAK